MSYATSTNKGFWLKNTKNLDDGGTVVTASGEELKISEFKNVTKI